MRNPLEKIQAQRVAIARKLALAGLRVFPLKPNTKSPAIKGWQKAATSDPDKAGAWWVYNPNYNIGIHAIDHLVVDQDLKDGGPEAWNEIVRQREMFGDEPAPTLTVWTGSGGIHEYYSLPPGKQVGNSTSTKFGRGIDIKSEGGIVVGPGSVIDGRTYDIIPTKKVKRGELQKIMYPPEWMIQRAEAPRDRSKLAGVRVTPETPEAVAEAKRWLSEDAPEAVEGQGGDLATFKIAAKMFDLGLEFDTAMELVWDWNIEKAHPQWEYEALETKLQSGMINRQRAIGVDNPGAPPAGMEDCDFGPGEEASIEKAPAEVKRHRWEFIDPHESRAIALEGRNPLVEGVVYEGEIDVTYGKSGSRKSIFTMDMDYHIWMGRDWYGRKVTQGPTLWVGAEGGKGVHLRNETMWAFHKPEGSPFFGLLQASMNLLRSKEDFQALLGAMQRKQDAWKRQVVKITIDTLTAVSAGGDLNGSDMTAMLERAWIIREKMGMPHMTLIHHPGKDQTKGMRGSQTMYDGVDATIFIKKETKRSGTAYLGKQRDGEDDMELLRFMAKDVPLPPDNKGRPRSGQVIVPRVTEGMAEVEKAIHEQKPPTIKEQEPWIALGTSESTYWRRKREGKL